MHSAFDHAFVTGTRFAERGGTIEVRTRQIADLMVVSGRISVADPFITGFDEPQTPLDRRVPLGRFPVELSIAHYANCDQRVAAARVRFAAPEVASVRWEPALFEGVEPSDHGEPAAYGVDAGTGCFFDCEARAPHDEATVEAWLEACNRNQVETWTWHAAEIGRANVVMFSSGSGDGIYGSYWGLSADGELVELVTDFDLLVGPSDESIELPLPLLRGRRVVHPLLARHKVKVRAPLFSGNTVIISGEGAARAELSDGSPVERTYKGEARHYTWKTASAGARLIIFVMTGVKPLDVVPAAP